MPHRGNQVLAHSIKAFLSPPQRMQRLWKPTHTMCPSGKGSDFASWLPTNTQLSKVFALCDANDICALTSWSCQLAGSHPVSRLGTPVDLPDRAVECGRKAPPYSQLGQRSFLTRPTDVSLRQLRRRPSSRHGCIPVMAGTAGVSIPVHSYRCTAIVYQSSGSAPRVWMILSSTRDTSPRPPCR
jgi:hypothetical protein